uniref:Uncharacterized protein n=1 Tax=Siphoviridae sp. ctKNZ79 TaxID=2825440 RepID=A0A8S5U9R5_9CAUD|nr:MAG TPA: hypothetical protein [Siphoviridae sp. ctKNZ79]
MACDLQKGAGIIPLLFYLCSTRSCVNRRISHKSRSSWH